VRASNDAADYLCADTSARTAVNH